MAWNPFKETVKETEKLVGNGLEIGGKCFDMKENTTILRGFLGGSDGKESACNAEDLGLIPELGRTPGEGNSDPF